MSIIVVVSHAKGGVDQVTMNNDVWAATLLNKKSCVLIIGYSF